MSIQQGTPIERTIFLSLLGTPSLGVPASNVICQYCKNGATALSYKALSSANWEEVGEGYYVISFTSADTSTARYFFYTLASSAFDNFVYDEFRIDPIYVGSPLQRYLYLTLNNVPSPNILYTQVTCQYRKEGETELSTKTLVPSSWVNLGNGFYAINFTGVDLSNVGYYFYTLTSSAFDSFLYDEFTVAAVPPASEEAPLCTLSGTVLNIGGGVSKHTRVVIRPILFPGTLVAGLANTSVVNADAIWTYVNSNGTFQLDVLQGATVIIDIENTGIHAQITIPMTSTANLTDLLPPFPIHA